MLLLHRSKTDTISRINRPYLRNSTDDLDSRSYSALRFFLSRVAYGAYDILFALPQMRIFACQCMWSE